MNFGAFIHLHTILIVVLGTSFVNILKLFLI